NPASDDAMTKAADGYALIEHYINWLAVPHATAAAGASVDVDLGAYTTGFGTVSPTFTLPGAPNPTLPPPPPPHPPPSHPPPPLPAARRLPGPAPLHLQREGPRRHGLRRPGHGPRHAVIVTSGC